MKTKSAISIVVLLAVISSASGQTTNLPAQDHVVIVIFENQKASSIYGNHSAPYFNQLANEGAKFTESYGDTHPSQPNYLAFFSGSTQGCRDDRTPPKGAPYSAPNLASELIDTGKTFGGFSEDLPSTGFKGSASGLYVRKHNPWVNFANVPDSVNMPFSSFPSDYSKLPTVSIVVPNMMNDIHDGTIAQGDEWLKSNS